MRKARIEEGTIKQRLTDRGNSTPYLSKRKQIQVRLRRGPRPKAQGPRPKAQGPRPKAQGPRPKAQGPRPKAQGPRPKAQGPRPQAQGPRPKAQGPRPKAQGPRPKAQGPRPKAQGQKSKAAQTSRIHGIDIHVLWFLCHVHLHQNLTGQNPVLGQQHIKSIDLSLRGRIR